MSGAVVKLQHFVDPQWGFGTPTVIVANENGVAEFGARQSGEFLATVSHPGYRTLQRGVFHGSRNNTVNLQLTRENP